MTARTWILTGSPENFAATRAHDFRVIGLKERRRRQALEIEAGDRLVFYLTRVMAFAASARIAGPLYEDRTPIWPGKPGKADPYPWRFTIEPEWVLEESAWIAAETLVDELSSAIEELVGAAGAQVRGGRRTVAKRRPRALRVAE